MLVGDPRQLAAELFLGLPRRDSGPQASQAVDEADAAVLVRVCLPRLFLTRVTWTLR